MGVGQGLGCIVNSQRRPVLAHPRPGPCKAPGQQSSVRAGISPPPQPPLPHAEVPTRQVSCTVSHRSTAPHAARPPLFLTVKDRV